MEMRQRATFTSGPIGDDGSEYDGGGGGGAKTKSPVHRLAICGIYLGVLFLSAMVLMHVYLLHNGPLHLDELLFSSAE